MSLRHRSLQRCGLRAFSEAVSATHELERRAGLAGRAFAGWRAAASRSNELRGDIAASLHWRSTVIHRAFTGWRAEAVAQRQGMTQARRAPIVHIFNQSTLGVKCCT